MTDTADFDLTVTNREGAERAFVSFNTVVNTANVRTFKRNGKDKISFRAACLPDNCIMNRIHYPPDVIADSVWSFNNVPVPYNHPEDSQGRFLSASRDPDGRVFGFLGGSYENVDRIKNSGNGNDPEESRVWGDVVLDVATLKSTKHGKAVLAQVQRGEPIDMSIGGFIDVVQTPSDPDRDYEALWFYADHFSILPPGETPASTTEQGTGGMVAAKECVFVSNKTRDSVTLRHFVCNMEQGNVPALGGADPGDKISDTPLTGASAGDRPASQDDEKQLERFTDMFKSWCRSHFTGSNSATATEESGDMADDTKNEVETSANAEAEATKTEAVTNAALSDEQKREVAEIVTNAVSEVVKPLIDAQTATNADAEAKATAHKAELVEKVVANNTLTQEIADATPVETLEALVANSDTTDKAAVVNGTGDGADAKPEASTIANALNGPKEAE